MNLSDAGFILSNSPSASGGGGGACGFTTGDTCCSIIGGTLSGWNSLHKFLEHFILFSTYFFLTSSHIFSFLTY